MRSPGLLYRREDNTMPNKLKAGMEFKDSRGRSFFLLERMQFSTASVWRVSIHDGPRAFTRHMTRQELQRAVGA